MFSADEDGLGLDALKSLGQSHGRGTKRKEPECELEDRSNSQGGKGKGKIQKATLKPTTGKRHQAKNAGARTKPEAAPAQTKQCRDCKKTLDVSLFWADQASCKECAKDNRNLNGLAKNQKCTEWLRSLNVKEKADLLKAYRKAKEKAEKDRAKLKFSLIQYQESVKAQQGQRCERRKRLMSESQYMKYAQTEEDLTKNQAEAKWQKMLHSPRYIKEGEAPKQKIYVPLQKELLDYDDVGASLRHLQRQSCCVRALSKANMGKSVYR